MSHRLKVVITTEFAAIHNWSDAPDDVAFLRNPHRHLFKVRVEKRVSHPEREIEVITFKREVDEIISVLNRMEIARNWSCETWAEKLLDSCRADLVEVMEDGENGAIAEKSNGVSSAQLSAAILQELNEQQRKSGILKT